MDLFYGEDIIAYIEMRETRSWTDKFDQFGIGDMNMLYNSGSFFIIIILYFVFSVTSNILNKLAIRYRKKKIMTNLGIYLEDKEFLGGCWKVFFTKLYLEGFFDMSFCITFGVIALIWNKDGSFAQFFTQPWDIFCSILTIFMAVTMSMFPLVSLYHLNKNYKDIESG